MTRAYRDASEPEGSMTNPSEAMIERRICDVCEAVVAAGDKAMACHCREMPWERQQAATPAAPVQDDDAELRRERDEAQSMVQAWVHVVDCLEAHIMDRAAMSDPANPETYLSILRDNVAGVKRSSEQICAARWADYKRHTQRIADLEARLTPDRVTPLVEALRKARDKFREYAQQHEAKARAANPGGSGRSTHGEAADRWAKVKSNAAMADMLDTALRDGGYDA